uniref:Uncharacterized protein n=1 Tax=Sus scrofa TaxID=9823 RepID=A0A4X1SR54_PIG
LNAISASLKRKGTQGFGKERREPSTGDTSLMLLLSLRHNIFCMIVCIIKVFMAFLVNLSCALEKNIYFAVVFSGSVL